MRDTEADRLKNKDVKLQSNKLKQRAGASPKTKEKYKKMNGEPAGKDQKQVHK